MSLIKDMLTSHPAGNSTVDMDAVAAAIDACLGEDMLGDMVSCIRTDLDCAEICAATGKVLARAEKDYASAADLVRTCAAACRR